jgi:hypothetical protein
MKDIQSILRATLIACIALGSLSCSTGSGGGGEDENAPILELSYEYGTTPTGAGSNVYAIWLKDKSSAYIQQLQACERANNDIFTAPNTLSGTALPYWTTKIVPTSTKDDIDAVTGPTERKKAFTVERVLARPDIRKFTVYFEHDQSWDTNDWFIANEPAVLYEVDIDLDNLQAEYTLQASGWTIGEDTIASGNMQFTPSATAVGTFISEIRYISMTKSGASFGVPDTGATAINAVKKITVKIK